MEDTWNDRYENDQIDMTALVSAASGGLGYAIAARLVADGDKVSICSSHGTRIKAAGERLAALGGEVLAVEADLASAEAVSGWISQSVEWGGAIDKLVINSPPPPPGNFESTTEIHWDHAYNLLLKSVVRVLTGARPHFSEGASVLISVSSSVKEPIPDLITSTVLRSAVAALAKSLASEWAPRVRVNLIVPGRIATDRVSKLDQRRADQDGVPIEEVERAFWSRIPLSRYGKPTEYSSAAAFLLSDGASYITGSMLVVDGGMLRGM